MLRVTKPSAPAPQPPRLPRVQRTGKLQARTVSFGENCDDGVILGDEASSAHLCASTLNVSFCLTLAVVWQLVPVDEPASQRGRLNLCSEQEAHRFMASLAADKVCIFMGYFAPRRPRRLVLSSGICPRRVSYVLIKAIKVQAMPTS